VSYTKTLNLLERELDHLLAKDVIIQAYFQPDQIRNDGWPRSSARPWQPGVIVSFRVHKNFYSYPCDAFSGFEDNLRAIALTLEALRAINRYGVTQGHEQYEGFKQLNAPATLDPRAAAASFIAIHAGVGTEDVRKDLNGAFRLAAKKLHPDSGGSHDLFVQLRAHYITLLGAPAGGVQ
jgi:hypothetical protein